MSKQQKRAHFPVRTVFYLITLLLSATICVRLSLWQHARWLEKKQIIASVKQEKQRRPTQVIDWSKKKPKFRRLLVSGRWVVDRQFLLANQMRSGRYGYDVMTPFKVPGSKAWLLVDRGWVAADEHYEAPDISLSPAKASIMGYVFYPSKRHLILGDVWLSSHKWPQKVQRMSFPLFSKRLEHSVLPFVLRMQKPTQQSYATDWVLVSFPASRHLSYMIQWLVFAGLFFLGAVLLSWKEWWKR